MKMAKKSLYNFVHSPVNLTSDDFDPTKSKKKSYSLDVGPLGIQCKMLGENSLETVYKQLSNGSYIIQPRYMLNSGTMCVTELYSNSLRVRLIHELLFKEKMELRDDKFPTIKKIQTKKVNPILQKKIEDLMKEPRSKAEMELMVKRSKEKKLSKNKSLIIYEKKYLCKHRNTDGAGTLLRNLSQTKKQLKVHPYLREKEQLSLLKRKKAYVPQRVIEPILSNTIKHINSKSRLIRLARNYEDNIGIIQNSLE